jgi:hypothetical protein
MSTDHDEDDGASAYPASSMPGKRRMAGAGAADDICLGVKEGMGATDAKQLQLERFWMGNRISPKSA